MTRRLVAFGAALAALSPARAQFFDPPRGYYYFVPDLEHGVFNNGAIGPFFKTLMFSRVDIVCLGDSNQLLFGRGWDEALANAWGDRYGLYATGLISAGENQGAGAGTGWNWQGLFPGAGTGFLYTGAPPFFDSFLNASAVLQPVGYLYLPDGVSASPASNMGLQMNADFVLDVNAGLRFWTTFATFNRASPAPFHPLVRLSDDPFTILTPPATIDAATGADGVATVPFDLAPAPRDAGINFRPFEPGLAPVGPFIQYYTRVERPDKPVGVSVHTLYAYGGQSARDMGAALQSASDQQLSLYFSLVRSLQGARKSVLIRISTGVNDRSELLPSLGPTPITPGNVPAAFKANLRAIIDRISAVWTLNQWPPEELFFLISISTPIQGPPDDSLLLDYRAAADQLALEVPRTAVTHFEKLTTFVELLREQYLLGGLDSFHLRPVGHLEMARRELLAAQDYACWCDLNTDGTLDTEDLYYDVSSQFNALQAPGATGPDGDGAQARSTRQRGAPMAGTRNADTAPVPGPRTSPKITRAVRIDEKLDITSAR